VLQIGAFRKKQLLLRRVQKKSELGALLFEKGVLSSKGRRVLPLQKTMQKNLP
tara:strand:- start:238 stop:396 length:159 start_codon:yes stop_codon:yes gene_type:complete